MNESAEALANQALGMIDQGDLVGAKALYEKACELDKADADSRMMLGVVQMGLGDHAEAERSLRQTLDLQPDSEEALFYLANSLRAQNRIEEAIEPVERATNIAPDYAEAWALLAGLQGLLGNFGDAEKSALRACSLQPQSVEAQMNLANALAAQRKLDDAAACYENVTRMQPGFAPAWSMLGRVRCRQGAFDAAVNCCREAIHLDPPARDARLDLGSALKELHRVDEALEVFRELVSQAPDLPEAHYGLGNIFVEQGAAGEAVESYKKVIALNPRYAEVHAMLGQALGMLGNYREALAAYQRSLEIAPGVAATHNGLSTIYTLLGRLDEAEASLYEALKLEPELAELHSNLGSVQEKQGKVENAVACFRRALELKPDFTEAHSNLLLALNYLPRTSPQDLYQEHVSWAETIESGVIQIHGHSNTQDASRRLRIGYVSPDFHRHPVATFIEPLLKNHDSEAFEVFCYADLAHSDEVTERLRGYVPHWRPIFGKPDSQVTQQIFADGIDILVDLAGHTGNNRLPVFAATPAPVQISYLGYPTTTGLSSMDYRITDRVTDSPDDSQYYSEELLFLPHLCCFTPPVAAPDVSDPPAIERNYVTFASFSNPAKVNDTVLDLWCRVLEAVPSSRFLFFRHTITDSVRDRLLKAFAGRGISNDRVEITCEVPEKYHTLLAGSRYLGLHGDVDIVLDTLPWNGHTVTCEHLWMGVPVLSLKGDRHVGRIGASVLGAIGLDNLVANTSDDFVNIAADLAGDNGELQRLRTGLRERMQGSPLCDGMAFTETVESAFRDVWRKWCQNHSMDT